MAHTTTLWRDVELVDVGHSSMATFLSWVQGRAQEMRRVRLGLREAGSNGNTGPAVTAVVNSLQQLTGLISLALSLPDSPLSLGSWAASLTHLRQLQLAAPELALTDVGAALTALTTLSLTGLTSQPLHAPSGAQQQRGEARLQASTACLPASLRALHLRDLELPRLPEALSTCTRLQLLALHGVHRPIAGANKAAVDFAVVRARGDACPAGLPTQRERNKCLLLLLNRPGAVLYQYGAPGNVAWQADIGGSFALCSLLQLSRLTGLTALCLEDVGLRAGQLPPQLTALSALQRLRVQTGVEATQEEPFAQLAACTPALTSLDLTDCMLVRFPSALVLLTQLRCVEVAAQ